MKFIRDIIARKAQRSLEKSKGPAPESTTVPPMEEIVAAPPTPVRRVSMQTRPGAPAEPAPKPEAKPATSSDERTIAELLKGDASATETTGDDNSRVYVWDMDEDGEDAAPAPAPQPRQRATVPTTRGKQAAAAASPESGAQRRPSRTKTRLLGFEKTESDVVDLFDGSSKSAQVGRAKFPVGWLIVTEGPGRGESFALVAGMSQIGRGEDQAVQLDFGDTAISRTNHAAVAYDPETHKFLLGHGGKSNIVRLNDMPVISTEPMGDGDIIRLGETTLRFVALCNDTFNWSENNDGSEESDDVAIA
ncbi:FHA domain-containing protein [Actibacterium sp. 188UL27-1]|uniref:FHA domain-containing protein n=1 Tax=Actibacterium sp. 188UL27-1 TaxID=2786961 RepID=UPI0019583EB9|nr:FHA domain-containing protein [Actibacterium sp. 188UL27-1]MBM7067976.1 FHA domain-containing protein [Actibacterium sp. 188UL27-1]